MELNREQVIKGLECLNDKHDRICDICPVLKLTDRGYSSCRHIILDEAVALIKELTEENERLRADTVREFAERLKGYYSILNSGTHGNLVAYHVEQVAKEMLEKPSRGDNSG